MTPNFERLELVVKAGESNVIERFNMSAVFRPGPAWCGTAGCLIGSFNAMFGENFDREETTFGRMNNDWEFFGITLYEYYWLFGALTMTGCRIRTSWAGRLSNVTRYEALSRLRKFIAYKKRKHALIHDPKYGVRDAARRAEGNQNFVMLAVADAAVAATPLATAT